LRAIRRCPRLLAGGNGTTFWSQPKCWLWFCLVVFFALPSVAHAGLNDGLTAYWNFESNLVDQAHGVVGTASTTANNLTFQGTNAGYTANGKIGAAYRGNGGNGYAQTADSVDLEASGNNLSFSVWFRVAAFDTTNQTLLAKGVANNYRIQREELNTNVKADPGGVGSGGLNVNDGQWHHIVYIHHAATGGALYLDGNPAGTSAVQSLSDSPTLFMIGQNPALLNRAWRGDIDEVGIWRRALTAVEVAQLWNGGNGITLPIPTTPAAQNDVFTMNRLRKARVLVLQNDSGSLDPASVEILTGPSFGTATPSATGAVQYQHTTGSPASDTFTYRVQGTTPGLSSTATVTVNFVANTRYDSDFAQLPATPPATAISLVDAFPGITFAQPTEFTKVPQTRAILVNEASGRIQAIHDTTAPTKALVLDIAARVWNDNNERALKGIAVHPQWPLQPYIFVGYNATNGNARLSRFTATSTSPILFDPASELIIVDQTCNDGFHSIGTLVFGPDGYLYCSFGDEGTQEDGHNNSQHIDRNFWSCIIRIDVDSDPANLDPNPDPTVVDPETGILPAGQTNNGNLRIPRLAGAGVTNGPAHYKVPRSNPFVATNLGGPWNGTFNGRALGPQAVRTEIVVTGLRNPWRFSPEDNNGDGIVDEIVVGDVGRSSREEVTFFAPGGNGMWSWREGDLPGVRTGQNLNGAAEANATNPTAPTWAYTRGSGPHQGFSVIGGLVYRGVAYPELVGKYICTDFVSGNIWALQRTAGAPNVVRLAGKTSLVAIALDPATDELLFACRSDGKIYRLKVGGDISYFPPTLTDVNFFADLATLTPNPGGVPYDVNLRFWSDYAKKQRWFLVPNTADLLHFSPADPWTYPSGMIWAKHFDIELVRGNPASARRLETRFLVKNAGGAYGVTYKWNHITDGQPQTEATLVESAGESLDLPIDQDNNPLTPAITQTWRFPSRSSCMTCHNPDAGTSLSFQTAQLNRTGTMQGVSGNLLNVLDQLGYLDAPPANPATLPKHVRPDQVEYSLQARARSWLDVNCAYCHRGASGNAPPSWDGRLKKTIAETGLIYGYSLGGVNDVNDRLIVPGDSEHSIIKHRIAETGGYTRMPPLASETVDEEGTQLITDYINQEASSLVTYQQFRQLYFGDLTSPTGEPDADPDGDGISNRMEWLTRTNPTNSNDRWQPTLNVTGNTLTIEVPGLANHSVTIWKSTNLATWTLWNVPDNDGIPMNPLFLHQFSETITGDRGFFKFGITER